VELNDLHFLTDIPGFLGACLVDGATGMTLGKEGNGSFDLEMAGAFNAQMVQAELKNMNELGIEDKIEDILISLGKAYHIIRPLGFYDEWFLYLVLDRQKANLAMARHALKSFEQALNYE